jgi:hypothetical protein
VTSLLSHCIGCPRNYTALGFGRAWQLSKEQSGAFPDVDSDPQGPQPELKSTEIGLKVIDEQ